MADRTYPLRNIFLFAVLAAFLFSHGTKVVPSFTVSTSCVELKQRQCETELNALDAFFNARRDARQKTRSIPNNQKILMDIFEPEAVCIMEERLGGKQKDPVRHEAFGDGPKFTCGVDFLAKRAGSEKDCLVYNVGSANRISFEVALQAFVGCEIHTFDPTLSTPYVGEKFSHFHPWGIGLDGENATIKDKEWIGKSIETIYKELGHQAQGRKIDILKIDCEGCEWKVMPMVFESMARGDLRIDQIQIEIHVNRNPPFEEVQSFFAGVDKAGLRVTHKERNHWGCFGYKCLEYVFIHEDFLRDANAFAMGCATSIDNLLSE